MSQSAALEASVEPRELFMNTECTLIGSWGSGRSHCRVTKFSRRTTLSATMKWMQAGRILYMGANCFCLESHCSPISFAN
eukprot:5921559-Pyramimonas_sp.AAC.1